MQLISLLNTLRVRVLLFYSCCVSIGMATGQHLPRPYSQRPHHRCFQRGVLSALRHVHSVTGRAHYDYVSLPALKRHAKRFDKIHSAHAGVQGRLGGHKKPDMLAAVLDQTKTLRTLSKTLRDIYDVMRFSVSASYRIR